MSMDTKVIKVNPEMFDDGELKEACEILKRNGLVAFPTETVYGLGGDNLIGQQEVVIKSIGSYINCSKIISGATILGDGEIALILEVNTLV